MVIINFNELDSTNKYLMRNYNSYPDFTFVRTQFQSEGKGREDRIWYSPKNENILASYLIKNEKFTSKFHLFSICTAVCIMKVLQEIGVKNVSIKWPNDVYVNDKKICGVLLQGQLPTFVVVGFGLNVNQIKFENEYRITPTSVALELRKKQNIKQLSEKIFKEIIRMSKHIDDYILLAQQNDYLTGKTIIYHNKEASCLGIQSDGALKIRDSSNKEISINSTEIIL